MSLPPPPPLTHTMAITVGDADIDELEHANNVAYLHWVQDVARLASRSVGLDMDAYRRIGGVFVVRRHEIDYLAPVVRGARLELRTWLESAHAAKCTRITEMNDESGTTVARAKTVWGFIELATGRPTRIADEVRAAFEI